MKKLTTGLKVGIGIGVFVLLIIFWFMGAYNGLVTTDEKVDQAFNNIQADYQRRADLIPNLIATVEGAATFEKETQMQIAALRTSAVAAKNAIQSANTPDQLMTAAKASDDVLNTFSGSSGLNINVERYPELRAIESFLSLQDELAGTENRIKESRKKYNEAIKDYNLKVRRFPSNMVANMFGFESEEGFTATTEGAENAPVVNIEI